MKNFLLLFTLLGLSFLSVRADRLENLPAVIEQPDGTRIHCLASGDEFFNYYHDSNGFTIIQNGEDGYYYYGIREGEQVVPSGFRVNSVDPAASGLTPGARISERLYRERRDAFLAPMKEKGLTDAPTTGQVIQLTIYISFADDSAYTTPRNAYFDAFSSMETSSLKSYYHEVSYERLFVDTYHYPISPDTINITYVSEHPRAYFLPYSSSNPEGYKDGERAGREHTLLRKACEFVDPQIPDTLQIDANNDGRVDNVSFVIKGGTSAWSTLLWPHRWSLYTQDARINGLQVRDYLFMLEGSFNVATLCHEFFHVLGAPDLYHYNDTGAPTAVGTWDIMDSSSGHHYMCAFMKYKYGDWMASLPEITESGTYTIYPLQNPENNVYRVKSPLHPSEYFVLEFRKRMGMYESSLPSEGLNVYRINPLAGNGNAQGPPDEVYIYRPGGTLTMEGSLSEAPLGKDRTAMSDGTNPPSFLYNGGNGGKGGLNIHNVINHGDSITFEITIHELHPPVDLSYEITEEGVALKWLRLYTAGFGNYVLYKNGERLATTNTASFTDSEITEGETYSYYVTASYGGEPGGESEPSNTVSFTPKGIQELPYQEDFEAENHGWRILGSANGFRWGDASLHEMNTSNETQFLAANSFASGYDANSTDMAITPRLNLSTYETAILEFDYTLKRIFSGDFLQVWMRRFPDDQWVELAKLGVSGFGVQYVWRSMKYDIPPDLMGSEAQIGFQYNDKDEPSYGVGIDNIVVRPTGTSVNTISNTHNIRLYPNPSEGQYTISLQGQFDGPTNIRVLNLSGQVLYEKNIPSEALSSRQNLDLSTLENGVYILVVQNQSHNFIEKLIKQNL